MAGLKIVSITWTSSLVPRGVAEEHSAPEGVSKDPECESELADSPELVLELISRCHQGVGVEVFGVECSVAMRNALDISGMGGKEAPDPASRARSCARA